MASATEKEDILQIIDNFLLIHRKHHYLFQRRGSQAQACGAWQKHHERSDHTKAKGSDDLARRHNLRRPHRLRRPLGLRRLYGLRRPHGPPRRPSGIGQAYGVPGAPAAPPAAISGSGGPEAAWLFGAVLALSFSWPMRSGTMPTRSGDSVGSSDTPGPWVGYRRPHGSGGHVGSDVPAVVAARCVRLAGACHRVTGAPHPASGRASGDIGSFEVRRELPRPCANRSTTMARAGCRDLPQPFDIGLPLSMEGSIHPSIYGALYQAMHAS